MADKKILLWTKNWLKQKNYRFCFCQQAESSNDWAKASAFKSPASPGIFLVAQQSKGRGRQGKSWEDSDLMLSLLWEKYLRDIPVGSDTAFALDLLESLKRTWPFLPLSIKAPNDLLLKGKKAGGLLLELVSQGSQTALVLGLGLNVFSCPKAVSGACLSDYAKNIHVRTWEFFLENLFSLWKVRAVKAEPLL